MGLKGRAQRKKGGGERENQRRIKNQKSKIKTEGIKPSQESTGSRTKAREVHGLRSVEDAVAEGGKALAPKKRGGTRGRSI